MGLLSSTFGTYSISRIVTKKAKELLAQTEIGKAFFEATDNIKEAITDKAKSIADGLVSSYAAKIEPDKWDQVVSQDVEANLEAMSDDELQEKTELAEAFSDAITKQDPEKWSNLAESIENNPVEWGCYLEEKNVTEEKIAEMEQEGVSGYDLLKLSFKMNVSDAKQVEDKKTEEDEKIEEKSDKETGNKTDSRYDEAVSELGDAACEQPSDDLDLPSR